MSDNGTRDRFEQTLRTEYATCTQRLTSDGTQVWQSTSIVVGASFAAAAVVSSRFGDMPMFLGVSLGAVMFFALLLLLLCYF